MNQNPLLTGFLFILILASAYTITSQSDPGDQKVMMTC